MGYNEAIDWIGGPEVITAGVVVRMGGEVNGIMLSVQQIEFVNLVLGHMVGRRSKITVSSQSWTVPPWWK